MATCDMGYDHEAGAADAPSEPEVILTTPPTSENDVAIAAIEADARVASDKAYAANRDAELEAENARLRGELEGMRAAQANPVVVQAPADPEPEPDPGPVITVADVDAEPSPPEDGGSSPEPKGEKKSKGGWFAGYK